MKNRGNKRKTSIYLCEINAKNEAIKGYVTNHTFSNREINLV